MTGEYLFVRFTDADREAAWACAVRHMERAARIGARDRFRSDSTQAHYIGALGELAFCRIVGIPWHCELRGTGGIPDLPGIEVRTAGPGAYRLELKTKGNDRPGVEVVLMAIVAGKDQPEAGAVYMGHASTDELRGRGTYRDPGRRGASAWFLDHHQLHDELPETELRAIWGDR